MVSIAVVACVGLFFGIVSAGDFDGWSQGRATYYGEDGGTTVHQGSCMMDIESGKGTGLDITALSDNAPDYKGSCGRCYEVACRPTTVRDGYGGTLDRTHSCQGQKSVIVTVTDTCPCYYPSNAYSNKRWCCGDEYHMDMSKYAYEKIGNLGHGVIGIYYRQVDCPGGSMASSSSRRDGNEQLSSSWSSSSSSSSGSSSSSSSSSDSSSSSSWSSSSSNSGGSSGSWSSSSGSGSSSSSSWSSSSDSGSSSSSSSWSGYAKGLRRLVTLQPAEQELAVVAAAA